MAMIAFQALCFALLCSLTIASTSEDFFRKQVPRPDTPNHVRELYFPTSSLKPSCSAPRWFRKAMDSVFKVGSFSNDFYKGDLKRNQGHKIYDNPARSGILLHQAWYVPVMRIDVKEFLPDDINITTFNKALALHVSQIGDRFFSRFKDMRPEDMNDAFFGSFKKALHSISLPCLRMHFDC